MTMPNKMSLKGTPRKFSDKIALIKQKEALSNASFQSAIHGLTEITMNRQPGNDIDNLEAKDNYSNKSYSPESFNSESTALSFKTVNSLPNDRGNIQMDNLSINHANEVFSSCHELSQRTEVLQAEPHDPVKYRYDSDRSRQQLQGERYSNIEGYFPHNKNLTRLLEPVSSGSLPDVSLWRNPKEFTTRNSDGNKHFRDSSNSDHIDLQETLSHLEQVKLGKNSKAALVEHLKNRGMQNTMIQHPHHIQSGHDPISVSIPNVISSPAMHRAVGHVHNHADSDCAGNLNESGCLKHYSVANSPYVSLSYRERHSTKDGGTGHRQRYLSGLANPTMKHLKLNINCCNDYEDYGLQNKALTPTGQQSNTWFENTKPEINASLLHPTMFSNILMNENGRRVASDSNIQNSLKYQNERVSHDPNFSNNPFERVNSLKRDQISHPYQRNQFMTAYPMQNAPNTYEVQSSPIDYQRETSQVSVTSSLFDNLFGLKSPDENLDPSLISDINVFRTPDISQGQIFVFNEIKDVPPVNVAVPPPIHDQENVITENMDTFMDSYDKPTETTIHSVHCDENLGNPSGRESAHECYWEQSDQLNTMYTKELSPTIKPCENLDAQDVVVDLYTDFEEIPDITFNDVDAQRRDSLNWTDEVLRNLNNESSTGDNGSSRDRSMSVYQPMGALAEEDKPLTELFNAY